MYYVKMTFTPFEKVEITEENVDELSMPLYGLLGNLGQNDQVYKGELIHNDGIFTAFFFMPELNTLEERNCNDRVLQDFSEIKKEYKITTEVLGNDATDYRLCGCEEPSWYFLFTNYIHNMSPIICGDCRGMIPIYKLSHVELPEGCDPGWWQGEHNLIVDLWFRSSFDRFTYRQQSNPKSELSKSGRAICAAYEKALNKPFYYFLSYWSESGRARSKKCPVCRQEWTLKDDIGFLNYKCDPCRLVGDGKSI